LRACGLGRGDRVAVLAYNRLEWIEIYVAARRAGLVVVPINFRLLAAESRVHRRAQRGARRDRATTRWSTASRSAALAARHVDRRRRLYVLAMASAPAWRRYEGARRLGAGRPAPSAARPRHMFALMYTSGTHRRPKGVRAQPRRQRAARVRDRARVRLVARGHGLLVMPMCHANSLYFFMTFLYLGATIVVDDRKSFDRRPCSPLRRERVDFHVARADALHHDARPAARDEGALRRLGGRQADRLVGAGAPRHQASHHRTHSATRGLFELYGSTEAGWVTMLRPDEQIERLGSVGREWAARARSACSTTTARGPDGEVGELFSRTRTSSTATGRTREDAEAFRGGWCSVGDMARRDGDGYIHLVDRKSNMIISGGENVYPSEVEA
jgi:acyl-CoA synthetase (AMP-forming)/AMP-acid ligase II